MSNVLDLNMPTYVVDEDKSKQTHIIINKKNARNVIVESPEKGYKPGEQTASSTEKVDDVQAPKSPYDPYEDELEFQFYVMLPDFKRFYDAAQTAIDELADESQLLEASSKAES